MKIAVANMWQNSTAYVYRYLAQFRALQAAAPQHEFEAVIAEGDSTDGNATWYKLNELFNGKVFKRVHGGQIYGPVDVTQRWLQISFVMDGVFEHIRPDHDAVIWVESDLIWEPQTMLKLLSYLERVDAVVPMIWMRSAFYDIWGYRKGGVHFTNEAPYHTLLSGPSENGLHLLDSGGGCVAMRGEIARTCRCRPPTLAAVGLYMDMKAHGWKVWLDPTLSVHHPPV